jgi:hypothetical protein
MGYIKNPEGVTPDFIRSARFEINVSGTRVSATAHLRAPYDPQRQKILA